LTVKVAAAPLKVTDVAPVRLAPVIPTLVPAGPLAGVKLAIVGAEAVTVKPLALLAAPAGVVTEITPVVAPVGTVAVTCVAESTIKMFALAPLKVTDVAPVRFVPVITTPVPTDPLVGEKLAIVGAGTVTVKLVALLAVPPGVVSEITPVVAPAGTVAVTCVAEFTAKVTALVPLNLTDVAPVRFVPVITTLVPTEPLVGEKLDIPGVTTKVPG